MFALCAMLLRINDIYFTNNVELHMAYHKLSSIKKMFPDLFWEENPAVRFLQANTSLHFGWSLMGGSTVLRDVYCSRYSSDSIFHPSSLTSAFSSPNIVWQNRSATVPSAVPFSVNYHYIWHQGKPLPNWLTLTS